MSDPDDAQGDRSATDKALFDAARARLRAEFGLHLAGEDQVALGERVARLQAASRDIRRVALTNADGPGLPVFGAAGRLGSVLARQAALSNGAMSSSSTGNADRDPELPFASIAELGALLRAGRADPVALAELALDRLERFGPTLNAVVTVTRERALRAASRARDELAAGIDRGPLHGIPYGAKDLLATGDGIPTSWGAAPFRQQQLGADATVIRRLDAAGAVLVAKLAMVELAGGFGYQQPDASFTGPGRNPWNTERWSGGSSSGSGAAVGAGLVPFAIGSETWGSITTPAAFCGVAGLRPTYGLVPTDGAMALSWSLDKLGPLGRTALDCGLVLDAMTSSADRAGRRQRRVGARGQRRPLRLALVKGNATDDLQPAVRVGFDQAVAVLQGLATLEEIAFPPLAYAAAMQTILAAEVAAAFRDFLAAGGPRSLTAPEDYIGGYAGTTVGAVDYLDALRIRRRAAHQLNTVLRPYDALVTPTLPGTASGIAERFRGTAWQRAAPTVRDASAAGNLIGLPAITVPMGFDSDGLPTGLSFLGRAHGEPQILAAAFAFQDATSWHRQHPLW